LQSWSEPYGHYGHTGPAHGGKTKFGSRPTDSIIGPL